MEILNYKEIDDKISEEVKEEELKDLLIKADEMVKTCSSEKNMAFGLSAPQIGIFKRFFVMAFRNETYQAIFNPRIFIENKKILIVREKCLSVPDETYLVKRPKEIRVVYFISDKDNKFIRVNKVLKNEEAITFSHEFDHLEGISIVKKGKKI